MSRDVDDELFERYGQRLHRYVSRHFGARDADDVVQETFLRLHERWHQVDTATDLWPWLQVVARRIGVDVKRASARAVPLDGDGLDAAAGPGPDLPAGEAVRRDATRRVRAALSRLSPADRDLLLALEVDGVPAVELARRTGSTPNAVRQRAWRARRRLAREVRGVGGARDMHLPVSIAGTELARPNRLAELKARAVEMGSFCGNAASVIPVALAAAPMVLAATAHPAAPAHPVRIDVVPAVSRPMVVPASPGGGQVRPAARVVVYESAIRPRLDVRHAPPTVVAAKAATRAAVRRNFPENPVRDVAVVRVLTSEGSVREGGRLS